MHLILSVFMSLPSVGLSFSLLLCLTYPVLLSLLCSIISLYFFSTQPGPLHLAYKYEMKVSYFSRSYICGMNLMLHVLNLKTVSFKLPNYSVHSYINSMQP